MKKILIADDDSSILSLLSFNFRHHDFNVTTVTDGKKALEKATKEKYDLILLDLMMPELSGIEVTKKLRQLEIYTPILILTAREDDQTKLDGLTAGSDEYLDKTTPMEEIIVRAKTLVRRAQSYSKAVPEELIPFALQDFGLLVIDPNNARVTFQQKELTLTKREYEILIYLIEHEGKIISREQLIQHFWGIDYTTETRTIDVLISKLRKKLNNQYIKTKRGFGYYFEKT
ncbi:MAG: response regulator transcription factor [Streptococcaceae bacterium]|nr:response regulator transcription factor [Streptococcaceae bacterium]MCL2681058.1 response regulator transcription factor [Streptococcaceae bacterium]